MSKLFNHHRCTLVIREVGIAGIKYVLNALYVKARDGLVVSACIGVWCTITFVVFANSLSEFRPCGFRPKIADIIGSNLEMGDVRPLHLRQGTAFELPDQFEK